MRIRTVIVVTLTAGAAVASWGAAASAGGGCMHGAAPTDGEGAVVELVDLCFTPTVLHVEVGTEVTFINRDDTAHEVTGVGGTWGSFDELGTGDRVSYAFETDGVYVYSCFLHPGMVGAIVAGSGAGSGGLQELSVTGGTMSGEAATPSAPSDAASESGALGALLLGGMLGMVAGGGLAATTLRRRRLAAEPS